VEAFVMRRHVAPVLSAVVTAVLVAVLATAVGGEIGRQAVGPSVPYPRPASTSVSSSTPAVTPTPAPATTSAPTPTPTAALTSAAPSRSPARLDPRCRHGFVVCISKADRRVRLVDDGRVLLSLAARFGSRSRPTREGTFHVTWKDRDHWSTTFESSMPFSLFFAGGQAIHYSADFARVGYAGASHGCVNLRSWSGAQRLFDLVPVGTRVVIS
jgi:lipoprotein-anchoring transpeptidase ErfK/SrfK